MGSSGWGVLGLGNCYGYNIRASAPFSFMPFQVAQPSIRVFRGVGKCLSFIWPILRIFPAGGVCLTNSLRLLPAVKNFIISQIII